MPKTYTPPLPSVSGNPPELPLQNHETRRLDSVRRGASRQNQFYEALTKSFVWRYGLALFFVSIALVLEMLLMGLFPYPFLLFFFAAVIASAWYGGSTAGLFAVLASMLAVDYFFIPPLDSLVINAAAATYCTAFIGTAFAASWVSAVKKRNEAELREARDQLEVRVAERTSELQQSNRELQEREHQLEVSYSELREREHQLRLLTEVIPHQIWSGTQEGSIDYSNQRLLDYVGRTTKEMQGERFLETIHPEDREDFRRSWHQALASEQPFEGEWRVRGADGGYRWFFTRGVPLRDAEGKMLRWYGTNTDVEERKKAEQALMKTQSDLAHLSRVLTMGELTSSIAHEITQPLTAVVIHGDACLDCLTADPPNLEEAREAAERIIENGTRAGAVLGHIRALFKKETLTKNFLNMNEMIQELNVFLRDELVGQGVTLQVDLAPELPRILGDRVQLQQVMLNLILNGMDAMSCITERAKELRIVTRQKDAAEILIQVEDCGVGLSSETADKIFEPFFTTKPQGIGMGLPISRSIVESHGGRLWAASRPTGGARFQFTVPVGASSSDG